tara:strand:+ start:4432 stop:5217 length:786 start_codon:yes stop_codon:yes gene_type:complete
MPATMTCVSITNAKRYELDKVKTFLPEVQSFEHERDALLLESEGGHILIFGFGCAVFWDISQAKRQDILQKLAQCASKPYEALEESCPYSYGKESNVFNEAITLVKDKSLNLQLLTISYGIAQSLKLSVFETDLMAMIKKTSHIPKSLQEKGKISMSNKEINKNIGSLIMAKHTINLHSDMLDSPDFLWENDKFTPLYHQTINDQDLPTRVQVLNKRLDIVQDLFHVLGDELKNRHSFIIESIIVLLIAMEVVISLVTHFM